ncbi:hypothetical protein KCP74_02130 [Salmonella enterica subsp. enterica]|nr:hypothetical protein KCP74_02130 [Salmonella enterica subsp. enterica]
MAIALSRRPTGQSAGRYRHVFTFAHRKASWRKGGYVMGWRKYLFNVGLKWGDVPETQRRSQITREYSVLVVAQARVKE